jgi:hypothetical protein
MYEKLHVYIRMYIYYFPHKNTYILPFGQPAGSAEYQLIFLTVSFQYRLTYMQVLSYNATSANAEYQLIIYTQIVSSIKMRADI